MAFIERSISEKSLWFFMTSFVVQTKHQHSDDLET